MRLRFSSGDNVIHKRFNHFSLVKIRGTHLAHTFLNPILSVLIEKQLPLFISTSFTISSRKTLASFRKLLITTKIFNYCLWCWCGFGNNGSQSRLAHDHSSTNCLYLELLKVSFSITQYSSWPYTLLSDKRNNNGLRNSDRWFLLKYQDY